MKKVIRSVNGSNLEKGMIMVKKVERGGFWGFLGIGNLLNRGVVKNVVTSTVQYTEQNIDDIEIIFEPSTFVYCLEESGESSRYNIRNSKPIKVLQEVEC